MAVNKQVSVTLSLNDSGFTAKSKAAGAAVTALKIELGSMAKAADTVETSVKQLGGDLKGFGEGLGATLRSLQATTDGLRRTMEGFAGLDRAQKESAKVAKSAATDHIDAKRRVLENEIESNKRIMASRADMVAKYQQQEADAAAKAAAARDRAAAAEKRMGPFAGKNIIAQNTGEAERHEAVAAAIRNEIAAINAWVDSYRTQQAARVAGIANLDKERATLLADAAQKETLAKIAKKVGADNADEMIRIRKLVAKNNKEATLAAAKDDADYARLVKQYAKQEEADRKAAEVAKRREMAETARFQKQQAREAAQEARVQAQQVAAIWKGMASTYAGSKIEKGLKASVNSADQYSRETLTLGAMNLPKEELDYITNKAWDDSRVLKFASALDTVKAKIALMGGLPNANQNLLDTLLPQAVKAANNIATITGDKSSHGMENMVRNIAGVIEARGQTTDPEAAKRTIDLIQKIYIGTGRKIDIADLETYLRRNATGADKIDDKGISQVVAFLDAAKVSGGGGGGGASGVSTVGTAFKMFQKMANGGLMTERASKQFVEAGLIDTSNMDASSPKRLKRQLREGGLNIAELANARPVEALEKIANAAYGWMAKPENLKKYFPNGDVNNETARKDAMMKWAIGTGWTTTGISMLTAAGNKDVMERAHAQEGNITKAKGVDALNKDVMESYAGSVQRFNASLENLKIVLGTNLLPMLSQFADWVSKVVGGLEKFSTDHKAATTAVEIGVAVAGAVLAFRGFTAVLGLGGSIIGMLTSMITPARGAAAGITAVGAAGSGLTTVFGANGLAKTFPVLNTGIGTIVDSMKKINPAAEAAGAGTTSAFARTVTAVGAAGGKIVATAGLIGRGLLGMVPIIGQLALLFTLTDWIANLEVGGAKVIDWVIGFGDRFVTGFQNMWNRVKMLFADEAGKLRLDIENIDRDLALRKRLIANGVMDKKELPNWNQAQEDRVANDRDQLLANAKRYHVARDHDTTPVDVPKPKAAGGGKQLTPEQIAGAYAGDKKKAKKERPEPIDRIDPLDRALQTAIGKVESNKITLNALKRGVEELSDIEDSVIEELEGKRLAGDFNKDHDTNKPVDELDPAYLNLVRETKTLRLQAEQKKALVFVNERVAASSYEAQMAMERMTSGGVEKQTDAFRALERELLRAEKRIGAGTTAFDSWARAKNTALFSQAVADSNNFAAGYVNRNKEDAAKLLGTERERIAAELEMARDAEDQKEELHRKTVIERRDLALKAVEAEVASEFLKRQRIEAINKEAGEALDQLDEKYSERRRIRTEQEIRAQETALQKMTRDWTDYGKAIEDIEAKAANGFVDMLVDSLGSGRLEIGKFLTGILADIAKTKLKETLGEPLKEIMSAGGNWVKENLFGPGAMGKGLGGKSDDGSENAAEMAKLTRQQGALADTTAEATDAVQAFTVEGVDMGTRSILENTLKQATGAATMTTFNSAVVNATAALQTMASMGGASVASGGAGMLASFLKGSPGGAAGPGMAVGATGGMDMGAGGDLMSIFSGFVGSANGNIMTSHGAVQLQKYARGGIATGPQLSLFGEGSMNEAYVPLPDGRTIPVTLQGGGAAPAVTVNVINQSGQPVNAEQGGMRFDGKAYILDVVMTAARTPGGFRQGLKEAVMK